MGTCRFQDKSDHTFQHTFPALAASEVCGFPICGSSSDDFGIGQMQYYPMDTMASKNEDIFSFVNPDEQKKWNQFLNNATCFCLSFFSF